MSVAETIVSVELAVLELTYDDLVTPYEWSGGVERRFHTIIASVQSEEHVGWGEAGFFQEGDALAERPDLLDPWLDAAAGVVLGKRVAAFRELGATLTSAPLPTEPDPAEAGHAWEMVRTGPLLWQPPAVAVELALWDLAARCAGLPLRTLLGPGMRNRIEFCACVGAMDPARVRRIASRLAEQGFSVMKFKGGGDVDHDVRILEAAREGAGDGARFRLDPNGAYDVGTARRLAHRVEDLGVEYLEEPCSYNELASFAALRRSSNVPIALDEVVTGPERVLEIAQAAAADVLLIELHQLGGVERLLKTAATASACALPLSSHTSYVTGVRTAALLHFAAATPAMRYAPDTVLHSLRTDVLSSPLTFDAGAIAVPEGPGIGVTVDEDALELHSTARLRRSLEAEARRGGHDVATG